MKIRVYYEDTDAGGIVYHSRYINFCERARSELFFENDLSPNTGKCHFAIKNIKANFVKFAKLGDLLEVHTHIKSMKNVSLVIYHAIKRGDDLIFTMEVTLVFLCMDGKMQKIPILYKEFFERFMTQSKSVLPTKESK